MPNSLQTVLDEIGTALEIAFPNLQVLVATEQITPPSAQIEPFTVDFSQAMNRGHERWDIIVRVLVSSASKRQGMLDLFEYFSPAKDIKAAIENHVPLLDGTVAHGAFVNRAENFALYEVSAVAYRGVEFHVDVYVA